MTSQASNAERTCDSCAYFKPQEGTGGTCHRFPPQFAGNGTPNEAHRWKFPWVGHHGWCGEHRPVPQVPSDCAGPA